MYNPLAKHPAMSGHLPAVRARHQKYLLARLPRDIGGDDGLFSTSVTTVVNTIQFPDHTIVETEAVTILVPLTDGPAITQVSILTTPTDTPVPAQDSSSATPVLPTSTSSSTSSSASDTSSSSPSPGSTSSQATSPAPTPTSTSTSSSLSETIAQNSHSTSGAPSLSSPALSPSGSSALDASGSSASSQPKGLSGGAIGGIVVAIILVAIAIVIYAVRKNFLRRRENRRISWGANVYPKPDFPETFNEKPAGLVPPPVPAKPVTPVTASIPLPPAMSYNNPAPPPITPVTPMRSSPSPTLQPAAAAAAVPLSPSGAHAYVRCTFIPNLPDELSITTGELVRVISEYDDGWALCQNVRGEQGVVPLECLDRGHPNAQAPGLYMGQGTGDWRMSRRASSLNAAQAAAAMRY